MIKLIDILNEIITNSFPNEISPDKDLGKEQLANYWVHVPKKKIQKIDDNKNMYFQKGYIFWREVYDYFKPEEYGEGQLILSDISDNNMSPTLADTSKPDLDSSKGIATISGKYINENPKHFQLYQYDSKADLYKKSDISL